MAGTKKTAAASTEVKKKFCTNCGKQLNEGEVCDCTTVKEVKEEKVEKEAPVAVSVNGDVIMESTKNIFKDVLDMVKKPATTLRKKLKNSDTKNAMILIILIALSFGVCMIAAFKYLYSLFALMFSGLFGGLLSTSSLSLSNVDIPYLKIFLYGAVISFVLAFVPILITLVIGKFTKSEDFDFKKCATLYAYSMSPMILAYLVLAVLFLLEISILTKIGLIALAFITISCTLTYIKGFVDSTSISEDRKSYVMSGTIIAWIVIVVLVLKLFSGSITTDSLGKAVTNSSKTTSSSIFK